MGRRRGDDAEPAPAKGAAPGGEKVVAGLELVGLDQRIPGMVKGLVVGKTNQDGALSHGAQGADGTLRVGAVAPIW